LGGNDDFFSGGSQLDNNGHPTDREHGGKDSTVDRLFPPGVPPVQADLNGTLHNPNVSNHLVAS
jgi:hypothetical protein